MSTNLPETYARVVAMRPELAVKSIGDPSVQMRYDTEGCFGWYWDDPAPKHIGDRFAAALILARWVEMLPVGNGLYHAENYENGETRWWIGPNASMPTPLEALAAFWLQQ